MKKETMDKIFNFLKEKEGKELPKNWNIIERLENHPDDIQYRYDGILSLSHSNITKLPNDLYVDGHLWLDNTNITKLPDKLYVDCSLSLENCKQLTKLPNNLYVGGYLDLTNCEHITELPDDLYVGRNLFIYNTPLAENYSVDEIRKMITSKGGTLIGKIFR